MLKRYAIIYESNALKKEQSSNKSQVLGIIVAKGGPALFCNCAHCKETQRRGGKDICTWSQILINSDRIVDFFADTYMHKLQYKIDMSKIKYL